MRGDGTPHVDTRKPTMSDPDQRDVPAPVVDLRFQGGRRRPGAKGHRSDDPVDADRLTTLAGTDGLGAVGVHLGTELGRLDLLLGTRPPRPDTRHTRQVSPNQRGGSAKPTSPGFTGIGHTHGVSTVVVHGAGSTGAAARRLLGLLSPDVIALEDRTGDVEAICAHLDRAASAASPCTHVIGVSLGAHAAVRWAARQSEPPAITCVLPAWTDDSGAHNAAYLTAASAQQIRRLGIDGVVRELTTRSPAPDIAALVSLAWSEYAVDELITCLETAARQRGPTPQELRSLRGPVSIVGWHHDDVHPAEVARTWSRLVPRARLAMAARPNVALLRQALGSVRPPESGPGCRPAEGAWGATRP